MKKAEISANILLIDDEDYLVKLWKRIIEKRGYRVTTCTGGLLALEKFNANPDSFDIIITDHSMPDITGRELSEEILKIRSDMKIIICSGYLGEVSKWNELDRKICEFITKPFDINTLINAIERNLTLPSELQVTNAKIHVDEDD